MRDKQIVEEFVKQWNSLPLQFKYLEIAEARMTMYQEGRDSHLYKVMVKITMADMNPDGKTFDDSTRQVIAWAFRHTSISFDDANAGCYTALLEQIMTLGMSALVGNIIDNNLIPSPPPNEEFND
jgi:hypothetical protein